ncbi:response regulator transcription factor [Blautia schinkii]|nr:response regulator transcription factor [Blautia schinkii]
MRILIIEDDVQLCRSLSYRLKKEGIQTDVCHDGELGLETARTGIYDLILLDRMLPGLSGTAVLRQLRKEGFAAPVILVTALGEIRERVEGLDSGADDYLVKPIAFEELMARIRSISRRPQNWDPDPVICFHDLSLNTQTKVLTCRDTSCNLTKTEGELLEMFLRNPGKVLARQFILVKVWGIDTEIEDGNLDNYIHFLRRRLSSVKSSLSIKTIRGIGYLLEV